MRKSVVLNSCIWYNKIVEFSDRICPYGHIIVMLHSGKILMVETKGDHLAKLAGKQYKYYMVFETKQPDYPGAYSLERFMEIVNGL